MRVSIALCTYNGQAHLQEQLASLMRQSRRPNEIVIGDDGSTDGTLELIRGFDFGTLDVKVLEGRVGGPTENFQRTMLACTGDLIFLCDQDDIWHPQKIERMVAAFSRDVSLVFCNARLVDEHLRPMNRTLWDSIGFEPAEGDRFLSQPEEALVFRTVAFGLTMAYRSGVNEYLAPVPRPFGHDNFTAILAASMGDVALVNSELVDYRQHVRQVSGGSNSFSRRLRRKNTSLVPDSNSYRACMARLAQIPSSHRSAHHGSLVRALKEKADHLEFRESLTDEASGRVVDVAFEFMSGRYSVYSNGWKSALRDLLGV